MAGSTMKAPPIVALCGHCYQGLRIGESHIKCKYCVMLFCDDCYDKHPRQHLIEHSVVLTPKLGPVPKKRCFYCLKNTPGHYDCDECTKSWCWPCGRKNVESFDKHEHREMTVTETPCGQIVGTLAANCQTCERNSSINHCGACRSGLGFGFIILCKTCWLEYDVGIPWCQKCFPTVKKLHEPSHEYISVKYERSSGSKVDYQVYCADCKEDFGEVVDKSMPKHAHRQFIIRIGSLAAEVTGYEGWKTCPRRGIRPDPPEADLQVKSKNCMRCSIALTFNTQNGFCPACRWHFCESCITSDTINHDCGEGIQICTWFERRAPDNFISKEKVKCEFCFKDIYKLYDAYLKCKCLFTICDECYNSSIPLEHTHPNGSEVKFEHFQSPKDQLPGTHWYQAFVKGSVYDK